MTRGALLFCLLLTSPAVAHNYWLVPATFTSKLGANMPVRLPARLACLHYFALRGFPT